MTNKLWDSDEFENYVSSGIIGLYESRPPKNKRKNKLFSVSDGEIEHVKNMGLFFSPGDRISLATEVICENPGYAILSDISGSEEGVGTGSITDINGNLCNGYMHHYYCQRIKRVPAEIKSPVGMGSVYEIISMSFFSDRGIFAHKNYAFLQKNGKTIPLLHRNPQYFPYPDELYREAAYSSIRLALSINFFDDRKYLWNVQAKEQKARVLFGVYPEQIKSLFYARDAPVKDSGRKRPILHWVSEHKRRMRNGIDVNIDKYLRGVTVFEMNGTEFEITTPQKM
jgi:hypothetical protein